MKKTWPGKNKISIVLVLLMLFVTTTVMPPANAASLSSSYTIMKNDPANQQFIERLKSNGATDTQIQSFLNDLDSQVAMSGSLNEANFNSVMYNALKEVIGWRKHQTIFMALMTGFSEEIDYILKYNQLHPNLIPLRNAVRDAVLAVPTSNTTTTGSTTTPTGNTTTEGTQATQTTTVNTTSEISTQISQQLAGQAGTAVSLTLNQNTQDINIPVSSLQQIISAGRELVISNQNVSLRIPAGAISSLSAGNLALSAKMISDANAAAILQKCSPEQELLGSVFDFNCSTDASNNEVKFQKPVTISLSYAGANLDNVSVNQIDVYYYNESTSKWERMNGTADQNAKTITYTTSHFSKYAIMTIANNQTVQKTTQQETIVSPVNANNSSTPASGDINFNDLNNHWARNDIQTMVKLGIVSGISPTSFAPDRQISRAEFATLLVKALKIPAGTVLSSRFNDVTSDKWYFGAVNAAATAGLVNGLASDTYGPEQAITREQMVVMIAKALNYQKNVEPLNQALVNNTLATFTDQNNISTWARDGAAKAVESGIVKGRGNGCFAPAANATRAEGSIMILKMFNKR